MCHVSHVTCHMSHVTCHVSHVTCHLSPVRSHYCQTSSKPPLPKPWRCRLFQRILPSPSCLPGCFSPSSLPGCPSPGARPPLLPAAGRPLVRRPGARCHPLGAGTWARDLPRGAGLHHSATKLAAALQDTPQQSHSREEKEDLKIV